MIPQFADYQQAWTALSNMSVGWWLAILIAAVVNQISYVWPYQAVLPGLRFRDGFTETQTTSAISNTVPAGGAVAIWMTFAMFGSVGFSTTAISTAAGAPGIWNLGFKFGLPIVAVVLVDLTGQGTGGAIGAALIGVLAIVVCGLGLWLIFRSEAAAHWVGRLADRLLKPAFRLLHKPPSGRAERWVLHFRTETIKVVGRRGWVLTGTVVASQLAVFVVLLFSARGVGISSAQVSFLEVLLAFAVARLVCAIPITPSGLGTVDAALIGMLTAFGASSSDALAADMVWPAATYFPPIIIGTVTYLLWKRGRAKHPVPAA